MNMQEYNKNMLEALPSKGKKREEAIALLGENPNHGEILLYLAETETGECRKVAKATLAQLNYPPAGNYWKKQIKSPIQNTPFIAPSNSDIISDLVADMALKQFRGILGNPQERIITRKNHDILQSILEMMLGKATEKMCDVYRFVVANRDCFTNLIPDPLSLYVDTTRFSPNQDFFFLPNEKLFPVLLTASIAKNPDERLMNLATELFKSEGGDWIGPVMLTTILQKTKEEVFNTFYPLYTNPAYQQSILNVLGIIKFDPKTNSYEILHSWGNYTPKDSRFSFRNSLPNGLDVRWIDVLATNPEEEKPSGITKTALYVGQVTGEFDDVLGDIIPLTDKECCKRVIPYFVKRADISTCIGNTYPGILYRLGYEDVENILLKKWACKENASSIWNVSADLQSQTHWPPARQLALFEKVEQLVKEKKLNISYWTPEKVEETKSKIINPTG